MADEIPASDLLKVKETLEKMEVDEKSTGSDQAVAQTPQSSSAASESAPSTGASESGPGGAQADLPVPGLVVTPEKSTAPSTGASESGPGGAQADLPVPGLVVTPEKSTPPSHMTPPTPESASKKTEGKKGFTRVIGHAFKKVKAALSPKKPEKLAIVAVYTSENPTSATAASSATAPSATAASGSKSKKSEKRGSLVVDDSPDGMETLMTEVPPSTDSVLKDDDAARKDSIASCDTGAHLSRLPSLDSTSGVEPEKEAPEKEDASDKEAPEKEDASDLAASPLKPGEDEGK